MATQPTSCPSCGTPLVEQKEENARLKQLVGELTLELKKSDERLA